MNRQRLGGRLDPKGLRSAENQYGSTSSARIRYRNSNADVRGRDSNTAAVFVRRAIDLELARARGAANFSPTHSRPFDGDAYGLQDMCGRFVATGPTKQDQVVTERADIELGRRSDYRHLATFDSG